jgi:hypothetical protein
VATTTYLARETFCETGIGIFRALTEPIAGSGKTTLDPAIEIAMTQDQKDRDFLINPQH